VNSIGLGQIPHFRHPRNCIFEEGKTYSLMDIWQQIGGKGYQIIAFIINYISSNNYQQEQLLLVAGRRGGEHSRGEEGKIENCKKKLFEHVQRWPKG
jgi:hypothetical protein